MHDFGIQEYLPRADRALSSVALVAAFGLNAIWAHKFLATPAATLDSFGFKNASKESSWPMLVNALRFVAWNVIFHSLFAFYLLVDISVQSSVWYLFVVFAIFTALHAYRAYGEGKSENLNDTAVANAKSNLMTFGVVTLLLFLAGVLLWSELYPGINYVIDDKKGLPADLSLIKNAMVRRFMSLKQHVMQ